MTAGPSASTPTEVTAPMTGPSASHAGPPPSASGPQQQHMTGGPQSHPTRSMLPTPGPTRVPAHPTSSRQPGPKNPRKRSASPEAKESRSEKRLRESREEYDGRVSISNEIHEEIDLSIPDSKFNSPAFTGAFQAVSLIL